MHMHILLVFWWCGSQCYLLSLAK